MRHMSWAVAVPAAAMVLGLWADPVEAQGRGRSADREAAEERERRPELRRRVNVEDWDGADDDGRGPPFCRNGEGHPVHGRQWCVDKGFGLGGETWYDRDDRYSEGRYPVGSYASAHDQFHAYHDRQCQIRAAERPLDPVWQIRVRTECKQTHDRWHQQAGRPHE